MPKDDPTYEEAAAKFDSAEPVQVYNLRSLKDEIDNLYELVYSLRDQVNGMSPFEIKGTITGRLYSDRAPQPQAFPSGTRPPGMYRTSDPAACDRVGGCLKEIGNYPCKCDDAAPPARGKWDGDFAGNEAGYPAGSNPYLLPGDEGYLE